MATSISAILISCLKSFNQLQERVEQPDYSHEREVSSVSWGDELGRLRVWAANIGAHQTGQSSLDFRLRDASHISNQITKLLQDLNRSLDDILDELSEDETKASEDDETEASWLDNNSTTELQQLREEVINIIDCLYQLSMLIRRPAQHDLLVGSRMNDKAEFAFYDEEHVRNLYPRTEEQISQRLGRAITRRRKYLNYRERHHRKLEKGIQRTTTGSVMSETIATDFKTPNIDFEETSDSGISQTSYAPSLIHGGRVIIPPPPRDSMGKPFECPYCFFIIDIKSTRSWNRHIFKDIKPYVCTFSECSMPDRLYDSRREWYSHEITEHLREDYVCSLCKETLKSFKQYERHVARHLEELALFALPRTEMDDAEYDDDDVVDARASTSGNGDTVDTAHSPDHSDHSSLASVTDDEDSTGTDVQICPRFYSPDHFDHSSLASLTYIREASTGTNVQVGSRSHSPDNTALMTERNLKKLLKENIAEYIRIKKEVEEQKEKEEKEEDEEFMKKLKKTFGQAGYDEETVEKTLKMGMEQGHGKSINIKTRDLRRPATVRVHRKHMSPETLRKYKLPWELDEVNTILPLLSSF